jgi:hypothetical protein
MPLKPFLNKEPLCLGLVFLSSSLLSAKAGGQDIPSPQPANTAIQSVSRLNHVLPFFEDKSRVSWSPFTLGLSNGHQRANELFLLSSGNPSNNRTYKRALKLLREGAINIDDRKFLDDICKGIKNLRDVANRPNEYLAHPIIAAPLAQLRVQPRTTLLSGGLLFSINSASLDVSYSRTTGRHYDITDNGQTLSVRPDSDSVTVRWEPFEPRPRLLRALKNYEQKYQDFRKEANDLLNILTNIQKYPNFQPEPTPGERGLIKRIDDIKDKEQDARNASAEFALIFNEAALEPRLALVGSYGNIEDIGTVYSGGFRYSFLYPYKGKPQPVEGTPERVSLRKPGVLFVLGVEAASISYRERLNPLGVMPETDSRVSLTLAHQDYVPYLRYREGGNLIPVRWLVQRGIDLRLPNRVDGEASLSFFGRWRGGGWDWKNERLRTDTGEINASIGYRWNDGCFVTLGFVLWTEKSPSK